jgi:ribosomal protein S18 acetylase RimI-like enzyme
MMLSIRKDIHSEDAGKIRGILSGTGFFDEAPDEIDVAMELVHSAIDDGNDAENYRILIAEDGSEVVGYICYAHVPCTLSTYEMYWICVDKRTQGKGVGRALVDEALGEVRGLGGVKIILYTAGREQYLPTQRFYASCGFALEARLKNYYAPGDDCLIYSMDVI